MKQLLAGCVVLGMVFCSISGCASIQKKFTRKKAEQKPVTKFLSDKDFQRAPDDILYKEHYRYCASWLDELVDGESFNYKSDVRNLKEAARHLGDMQKYLPQEKKEALQKYGDELIALAATINETTSPLKENVRIMSRLRSIKRDIDNNYSFSKVKEYFTKNEEKPASGGANAQ